MILTQLSQKKIKLLYKGYCHEKINSAEKQKTFSI